MTHTHASVTAWLAKHPRFTLQVAPTSSPWLNLAEHRVRELTQKASRCGIFCSVTQLVAAIEEFLADHKHLRGG